AKALRKDTVTAGGLVVDADGGISVLQHSSQEEVGPAVVFIIVRTTAVCNGITQNDEGRGVLGRPGLNNRDKIPVHSLATVDVGRVDLVTRLHPTGCPASGMTGDLVPSLSTRKVQRNRDHLLWLDGKIDWVSVSHRPSWNCDRVPSVKGELLEGGGV